jgi:hypothetical protein
MIEETKAELRPVEGISPGFFLLSFRVEPASKVALEARLAAAGARIESRTDYTSYARDPEGNRVAISHYPLEAQT